MKKLLIGLTLLASMSSFADTVKCTAGMQLGPIGVEEMANELAGDEGIKSLAISNSGTQGMFSTVCVVLED
jgi:hypothetical protein